MAFTQGTNTIGRKKFRFIQHATSIFVSLVPRNTESKCFSPDIFFIPTGNKGSQIRTVIQEPVQPAHKFFLLQENIIFQNFHSKQRNQSDHGTEFQTAVIGHHQLYNIS